LLSSWYLLKVTSSLYVRYRKAYGAKGSGPEFGLIFIKTVTEIASPAQRNWLAPEGADIEWELVGIERWRVDGKRKKRKRET
jgi:hypothetical protein